MAGQQLRDLAFPGGALVTLILRGRDVVVPRGTTLLMPGDHVFLAMRISLEPFINRLFDPDPEPALLPSDLQLSFSAVTTIGQVHSFLGLPLPPDLAETDAGQSLEALLSHRDPCAGIHIGALNIRAGADSEHVLVSCITKAI